MGVDVLEPIVLEIERWFETRQRNTKKSAGNVFEGRQMKYRFIETCPQKYVVGRLCTLLGISRSAYYAWKKHKTSQREQNNQASIEHIRRVHKKYRKTYGSPRVYAQLKKEGIFCNQKRVARLMQQDGLKGQCKYRKISTTDSKHAYPVAHNILNREFKAEKPNQKWVADITYISTQEGWLYVAGIVLSLKTRFSSFQEDSDYVQTWFFVCGWYLSAFSKDKASVLTKPGF